MGIAYFNVQTTAFATGALLLFMLSLGATSNDARAQAPASPKTSAYLPVEDLPPEREKPAMTPDERSKLKKELIAARDRQAAAAKARGGATRAEPAKP